MTFDEWMLAVPERLMRDPLWRRTDYRLACYASDVAWQDAERLATHAATHSLADQLYRAVGSIGANIAEGYSRGGGADRVRFYEFALGSAREAREWYWKGRHVLDDSTLDARVHVLEQVVRLLVTAIRAERNARPISARVWGSGRKE